MFDKQREAKAAAFLALKLMPEGWRVSTWSDKGEEWYYNLENGPVIVHPEKGGGWSCLIGVPMKGFEGIYGGPWTTRTVHPHPGKATMYEAEAMNTFVQQHLDTFETVCEACVGLEEFGTPEKDDDKYAQDT